MSSWPDPSLVPDGSRMVRLPAWCSPWSLQSQEPVAAWPVRHRRRAEAPGGRGRPLGVWLLLGRGRPPARGGPVGGSMIFESLAVLGAVDRRRDRWIPRIFRTGGAVAAPKKGPQEEPSEMSFLATPQEVRAFLDSIPEYKADA